jgi:regulatory protein
MTVESVEAGRDRLTVKFDNGAVLTVGTVYLPPEYSGAFLRTGAVIDSPAETVLRFAEECFAAEKAALRLVARAEQSSSALTYKLQRRGYGASAAGVVISRLLELNLVNDGRYAELWLRYRMRRGSTGPRALAAALRQKVGRESAEAAFRAALTPDVEAALLERRLAKAFRKGLPEAAGIRFFLRGEGFSSAAIEGYFDEQAAGTKEP